MAEERGGDRLAMQFRNELIVGVVCAVIFFAVVPDRATWKDAFRIWVAILAGMTLAQGVAPFLIAYRDPSPIRQEATD